MRTRLLVILNFVMVLAVIALIGAYRARQRAEQVSTPVIKPAVVKTIELEAREYEITESFYGLIEANVRVDMAFQISGRIAQIGPTASKTLKENDRVKQGDMLAAVDPDRYKAAVKQAQAMQEEVKAALATAQSQIDDADARVRDAQLEVDKIAQLVKASAAPERQLEKAQLALKIAQAQLDAANAAKRSAEAVYQARAADAEMAQINLEDATLVAPFDATIAAVPVEVGQMVQPGDPVMTLVDLENVRLVIGVVESRLPLLEEGQKVEVAVEALGALRRAGHEAAPTVVEGVVATVPPAADQASGVFRVEIKLPNNDDRLRPGMIGRAKVTVNKAVAVAVPAEAAVRDGRHMAAFFVDRGYKTGLDLGEVGSVTIDVPTSVARKFRLTPITGDGDSYLVDNLPEGVDRIVIAGQSRLVDGQPVQVVDERRVTPAADAQAAVAP